MSSGDWYREGGRELERMDVIKAVSANQRAQLNLKPLFSCSWVVMLRGWSWVLDWIAFTLPLLHLQRRAVVGCSVKARQCMCRQDIYLHSLHVLCCSALYCTK